VKRFAVVCGSYQYSDRYYLDKVDTMKDALESMARDGIEVSLFAVTQARQPYTVEHNGVTYRYHSGGTIQAAHDALVTSLKAWRPDAVVMKDIHNPATALTCTHVSGKKMAIFCGGELRPPTMAVDCVMVASQGMADVLIRQGYPAERIIPRAFGVDTNLFTPEVTPEVPRKYDLIYVADWRQNKRQELLIDVMSVTPIRVCFLGAQNGIYNKDYFTRCMARANRLGVTHLTEGFHAEPCKPPLSHAVQYLLDNPAVARELGQAGRRKVQALWHGRAMEEDFRRLLA